MKQTLVLCALSLVLSSAAVAESPDPCDGFPHNKNLKKARIIKVMVPSIAGGSTWVTAKVFEKGLSEFFAKRKPPVDKALMVEANGTNSGMVAAGMVKNSEPDGSTLLLGTHAVLQMSPKVKNANVKYSPDDFEPIAPIGREPMILACNKKYFPKGTTVDAFIARVKKKDFAFGTAGGLGGIQSAMMARLERSAAIPADQALRASYSGLGPLVGELKSGEIECSFISVNTAKSLADSGDVTFIGTSGENEIFIGGGDPIPPIGRSAAAGDFGSLYTSVGLFGPKGMDARDMDCLNQATQSIFAQDWAEKSMKARAVDVAAPVSRAEYREKLAGKEAAEWAQAAEDINRLIGLKDGTIAPETKSGER